MSLNIGIFYSAQGSDAASLPELLPEIVLESMTASTAMGQNQGRVRETILLVEDEDFVRKATAEVLEAAGYRVTVASSATEALDTQRRCESVDLLLADVVMPGISGHELAAKFLMLHPQVRILLMSGYSEELTLCEAVPVVREYMAKPFSIPTLLRRVREVLDKDFFCGGNSD